MRLQHFINPDRLPFAMSAKQVFSFFLSDEQMRAHLKNGSTLIFKGLEHEWQAIERQVERLGFGETYLVTQISGPHGGFTKVKPIHEGLLARDMSLMPTSFSNYRQSGA